MRWMNRLTPERKLSLINAIVAQTAWWICVLAAKSSPLVIPLAATLFVIAVHFAWIATNWRRDLTILIIFTIYGSALDSILIQQGIYILPDGGQWAPIWLISLWSIYATNLEYSLKWVASRPWLGAALGAFFGPVSYAAGSTFGILILREPKWQSIAVSSVMWALSTPFVYAVLNRSVKS